MATIIDTLNLKLTQAQANFYQYSSAIIEGLTTGNIKPNVNKKLSIISYWLEMLENGIPNCQTAQLVDPESITITITPEDFFNLSGHVNCNMWEYFWVRNKFGELVPLGKFEIVVTHQYYPSGAYLSTTLNSSATYASLNYGFNGSLLVRDDIGNSVTIITPQVLPNTPHNFAGVRAPYNNANGGGEYNSDYSLFGEVGTPFPINITSTSNASVLNLTFTFKDVGSLYNNQKIETSGRFLNIDSPEILGGKDPQFCESLTQDQINCYSKILDYIAIELGFNYEVSLIEPTSYATVVSGDNNETITLEDGNTLDLEDPHDTVDPNSFLPKKNSKNKRGY